jgi:microcystin-dependent protein
MSEPFIGEIKMVGFNFAPRGWTLCNGQLLPIAQNTALFSILGTTYGGDGRTTFGMPDLQGRSPMHAGNGPALSQRRLGQKAGAETVTLGPGQTAAHTHAWQVADEVGNQTSPADNALARSPTGRGGYLLYESGASSAAMAPEVVAETGDGLPHNNIQPALVVNFVIALQGTFPSRS